MDNDKIDRIKASMLQKSLERKRAENDIKFKEGSKKRLMEAIQTHFKTVMIGSLNDFESTFGFLWGHGQSEETLTEEQKEFAELWQEVRTSVLNRGNNKMRAALDELSKYEFKWTGYRVEFLVKKDIKE